jgi:Concanavalin A-like lectin/glucanases superfamily
MDTRTILISLMTLIILGVMILIIYEFSYGFMTGIPPGLRPSLESVTIVGPLQDGQTNQEFNSLLPLSNNETDGIEFSYAAWILIKDFDPPNQNPVLFTKGDLDLKLQSPSVVMTSGKNQITITQDTYDKSYPERIVIGNLPAGKLNHFAICVNQLSLDVYVNGLLYRHVTMKKLPLQNTQPVYVAGNGGWNGEIGSLVYYNYALTPDAVRSLANTRPSVSADSLPYYPSYLSTDWWIGTHH